MQKKDRTFSGTVHPEPSEREILNREVACEAAREGIVLLKNEGILPVKSGQSIALFGGGARYTIKGGTGSGDVCEREQISVYRGLKEAGFVITSRAWLDDYDEIYQKARNDWKECILQEAEGMPPEQFLDRYAAHAFEMPEGRKIVSEDVGNASVGIYVISRVAGEAADRRLQPGDYYLSGHEKRELHDIAKYCESIVVLLNTGAQIDLTEILEIPQVKGLVYISQPGMDGGKAVADILSGNISPSGKLTDTWAMKYDDFPNASAFSYLDENCSREVYSEGIYVGYRYFEAFEKKAAYPFGFGLSYTDFEIRTEAVTACENRISVEVSVKNTGHTYAGKEVVQIYVACPQNRPKELKKLCAFAKTKTLMPGEDQKLQLSFNAKEIACFSEEESAWVVENGKYAVLAGNSSARTELVSFLEVEHDVILEQVKSICPLKEVLEEMVPLEGFDKAWTQWLGETKTTVVKFEPMPERVIRIPENKYENLAEEMTARMTEKQMVTLVVGEVSKSHNVALGAAGIMVPGAAGETSSALEEVYGIPGISMADGPAGLRLIKEYQADVMSGQVYTQGLLGALENGFFAEKKEYPGATTFYQYCTALPIGTMLAQTWNEDLVEKAGHAVGVEMAEFGISLWLAPGMNIHRNPLCGRNFEYYSEDPLLSGLMAAAMTIGVQKVPGVGTTIKHFACNNLEENRMGSDSIVSQRALREIYLRGFEIAVKRAQPMAIMTSYNLINGVHTANSRDLCTIAVREEWNFQGMIMTDWTTTSDIGHSIPWECIRAGNDLIMPGLNSDTENILEALNQGWLSKKELRDCVQRLLKVIYQTLAFEGCEGYGMQFKETV